LFILFDSGRKISLKKARKKQKRRERSLKRLRSQGKWTHGTSSAEKMRRLKEARALATAAQKA